MTEGKIYEFAEIRVHLLENEAQKFTAFLCKLSPPPVLKSMIKTDENGLIIGFEPKNVPWGFVFFVQNVMINQRLRMMDALARKEGLIK